MTRAQIAALVARIEAGETGRELDRAVARAVGWHRVEPRHTRVKNGGWIAPEDFRGVMSSGAPILDSLHGTDIHRDVPSFTTSIDAQAALPGRIVATGFIPEIETVGFPEHWFAQADRKPTSGNMSNVYHATAPTRAGAELAAHLRAMMETCDD
jgi:hypothetical protein